jgi:hypothetical protein
MGQDPTLGRQNMSVQTYINELKQQLDLLYLLVEQMQQGLSPDSALKQTDLINKMTSAVDPAVFALDWRIGGESCQHKDVVSDQSMALEGHPMNEHVSPELQVKRLTAQLTVAYKRIAQLEEQLLSRQIEHNGSEYIYSS